PAISEFLELALRARRNVLVAGGAGAGASVLIGALASAMPGEERVVTVEHVASMDLGREHGVALEAQPPRVSMRDLVCELRRRRFRAVRGVRVEARRYRQRHPRQVRAVRVRAEILRGPVAARRGREPGHLPGVARRLPAPPSRCSIAGVWSAPAARSTAA